MKTAVFSLHKFEKSFLENANNGKHELLLVESRLTAETAIFAKGCIAVSLFVSDDASTPVLELLHELGIRFIVLRSAGFNNVDIKKAMELGIRIARVPAYSPFAVAEHTVALIMGLNRKLVRANNRISEGNFSLDGLTGFDMNGKVAGILGTGKIGAIVAKILHGFGCTLLGYDAYPNEALVTQFGMKYTDLETVYKNADILTLHTPLNDQTRYIINRKSIEHMKTGVMLINTSRGGLVNTKDVIVALKKGKIGYFGMDVYEEEEGLFFEDHSDDILVDDVIARLMTFRNVLITSHQAFLTQTALENIADTTIYNLDCFDENKDSQNEVII
ncbi:MAG: 2-hydroxyacid dehydrogenase [Chitinophagaceae bacterium]|nr:MAG: 2-hydroxyacid dehydrogenase [Chitinophagaceae bacterium]